MATRWHPDTCTCAVVMDVAENGDLFIVAVENRCELHASIEDDQALLDTVADHNRNSKKG